MEMSEYGVILDSSEPEEYNMYKFFFEYFNNPLMVKIKNVKNFSMYMVKNYCLLSRDCRYIIALIEEDRLPIGYKKFMEDLYWVSLQTRTLSLSYSSHDLEPHSYIAENKGPLKCNISCIHKEQSHSIYKCNDFPLKITILNPEKNEENPYQNSGTIITALETYNTVITKISK